MSPITKRLAMYALFVVTMAAVVNHAQPVGAASAGRLEFCSEVCGPWAECEEPCLFDWPELPPWESTCEQYPLINPWEPNCKGICGDDYCNEYNDEYWDTECTEDCGACQDGECQPGHEAYGDECYDCGYCGDGRCFPREMPGAANQCVADCGENPEPQPTPECNPITGSGCAPGWYCNSSAQCVQPSEECNPTGGVCHEGSECCESGEICWIPPHDPGNVPFYFGWCLKTRILPTQRAASISSK